ncbi:MAG: glycosyltransferase [Actinomycetota bacterium]|nr:glycosyltransferase [Actinomycetota bacterium]
MAFDACDSDLMLRLVAQGRCPSLAGLLRDAAVADTVLPFGTFVGSTWMTVATATDVATHGFWNWLEVDPAYGLRFTTPRDVVQRSFWEHLSDAGRRVAVIDIPHMGLPTAFNGVAVKEWGCHDRHDGTATYPPELLDELDRVVGRHTIGCRPDPNGKDAFAPCDSTHRVVRYRTLDEERQLLRLIEQGVDAKRHACTHLLTQGPWDLFATVLGEAHCVGHQLWHVHDPSHPRHDPAAHALLGDPVEQVYERLDGVLGDLLAHVDPETTVYVHLSHGMGSHFDGHHLLDQVLQRIDDALDRTYAPGLWSRSAGRAYALVRGRARRTAGRAAAAAARWKLRRGSPAPLPPPGPSADRRFYQLFGNTSVGAVRFNVVGREAHGRVQPGGEYERLRDAVAAALLDVVDIDSGLPLVRSVVKAESVYDRRHHDRLPDLFVEWERSVQIERVWSPLIGTVVAPYPDWRTGDHYERGLFVARGPGILPGQRSQPMPLVDVGPTIAAALGVELPGVEGRPRRDMVAGAGDAVPPVLAEPKPQPSARRSVRRWNDRHDRVGTGALDLAATTASRVDALIEQITSERDAMQQHHARQEREIAELRREVKDLDRLQTIWTTMAWLANDRTDEAALVSVITPTYHRPERLGEAIRSVIAQRHTNWEMIIVDDGSNTAGPVVDGFADDRIKLFHIDNGGAARARNAALQHVSGDIITYLDDDNFLDPSWLHAVAWAFRHHPDTSVMYGVRIFDDSSAVFRGERGWPWVNFSEFDRQALEQSMFADMGVLAHRSDVPARFDESLKEAADWDFFLALTEDAPALALPAIAVYYRTDGDVRLSGGHPSDHEVIRQKWARRRQERQGR